MEYSGYITQAEYNTTFGRVPATNPYHLQGMIHLLSGTAEIQIGGKMQDEPLT
jgi:hypothetical protein